MKTKTITEQFEELQSTISQIEQWKTVQRIIDVHTAITDDIKKHHSDLMDVIIKELNGEPLAPRRRRRTKKEMASIAENTSLSHEQSQQQTDRPS